MREFRGLGLGAAVWGLCLRAVGLPFRVQTTIKNLGPCRVCAWGRYLWLESLGLTSLD